MTTELAVTPEFLPIAPESLEIANTYIATMDLKETASQLDLPLEKVVEYISKPEVKAYISEIFLSSGYRNRFKLGTLVDKIIDDKILEMQEAGMTTSKDILEVLTLVHKMRMEELGLMLDYEKLKHKPAARQTNILIEGGGTKKRSIFETLISENDIGNI